MKTYSGEAPKPPKLSVVFPVVDTLPDPLEVGETVYKNDPMFPGLYIYLGDKRWVTIMSPKNNIIEEHIANPDQKMFTLSTAYPTDGHSLNVYVNGTRLAKNQYAELSETLVCLKEDGMLNGGERIEFQIFNKFEERIHHTRGHNYKD
jgi:hypothetical protein